MDPVSIVATAFTVAGNAAKASVAIAKFISAVRDSEGDLASVSQELKALIMVLDPLGKCLNRAKGGPVLPDELIDRVNDTLDGCNLAINAITETLRKYQRDTTWTKITWALFGQGDMLKLRDSLEAYKMALSLGFIAISMTVSESIKDDTKVVKEYEGAILINTEEILARLHSIRQDALPQRHGKVELWIEQMAILSSYAESTYQSTILDNTERDVDDIRLNPQTLPGSGTAKDSQTTNQVQVTKASQAPDTHGTTDEGHTNHSTDKERGSGVTSSVKRLSGDSQTAMRPSSASSNLEAAASASVPSLAHASVRS